MKNSIIKKSGIKSIKNYLMLAIILASNFSFSQGAAFQFGYVKLEKSSPYFGMDFRVDEQDAGSFVNIGFGTILSRTETESKFIPEIHANVTALILMLDLSATTKAINPGLGINLGNAVKVKFGYNFALDSSHFKGTTFGLNICLGNKKYYKSESVKIKFP